MRSPQICLELDFLGADIRGEMWACLKGELAKGPTMLESSKPASTDKLINVTVVLISHC